MSFGDADLAMMLGDVFSVPVSFGATTTNGIVDFHDIQQFDEDGSARVVGRVRGVTLQTSLLGSLAEGDAITVSGVAYVVRGTPAQQDGATSIVYLRG